MKTEQHTHVCAFLNFSGIPIYRPSPACAKCPSRRLLYSWPTIEPQKEGEARSQILPHPFRHDALGQVDYLAPPFASEDFDNARTNLSTQIFGSPTSHPRPRCATRLSQLCILRNPLVDDYLRLPCNGPQEEKDHRHFGPSWDMVLLSKLVPVLEDLDCSRTKDLSTTSTPFSPFVDEACTVLFP